MFIHTEIDIEMYLHNSIKYHSLNSKKIATYYKHTQCCYNDTLRVDLYIIGI